MFLDLYTPTPDPIGREYSQAKLQAIQFTQDLRASLQDVADADLLLWLRALGVDVLCDCRALLRDEYPQEFDAPVVRTHAAIANEPTYSQTRFAWPASIADEPEFPRAMLRLSRVDHPAATWDPAIETWDAAKIAAALVFTDDSNFVRLLNQPTGWTFAGEVLSNRDSLPQGADGRFPARSANDVSLLCGKTLHPGDAIRLAIHAFGPDRQYIGYVVLTVE